MSRVDGKMSRVEGKMSRVTKMSSDASCQKARIVMSFLRH